MVFNSGFKGLNLQKFEGVCGMAVSVLWFSRG